jgi:hypothetical protein
MLTRIERRTLLRALGATIILGAFPWLAGCGEQKPKKENIDEIVQAQDRARRVRAQADIQAIHSALQEHQIQNGRFPDRLEDLPFVTDRNIDTSWYAYDAASGQVRMREP